MDVSLLSHVDIHTPFSGYVVCSGQGMAGSSITFENVPSCIQLGIDT